MVSSRRILSSLLEEFPIQGGVKEIIPFGNGHINDTFRIINSDQEKPDYLLQRINHEVFSDVKGLMNNIHLVTEHLKGKSDKTKNPQSTLNLLRTRTNELFATDGQANYWRVFDFKKDTRTYDLVNTSEQAYQGAHAFGLFIKGMSDFDSNKLVETIPNFHNVIYRLDEFKHGLNRADKPRVRKARDLIRFIETHADDLCRIEKARLAGKLPTRVTHNDTKFNNVLLDSNDYAVCVIDLDTVMPGIIQYDFGDGIRTSTNMANEDEPDLSKVNFDIDKFEAFTAGYLDGVGGILKSIEIEFLAISGALLSFIMGVRFLSDYFNNDSYFKTVHSEQNFMRAACQFELARQILKRQTELDSSVKRLVANSNSE